jgi:hypothetical protein
MIVRAVMMSAVLAAGALLSGCNSDDVSLASNAKANQPVPPKLVAAMTDEQIAEIYSLGRESFFGGQRSFQFQAYPFRMTPVNFAKHRNNPNMPFWKMIKEGNDHFEVTHQEPKVEFCEHKYVFDPAAPAGSTRPLMFNASAACPAYVTPDDIASAVREKQQRDNAEIAKLISKGTPVARLNTGIDGGMNRVFAAKLPDGQTGLSDPVEASLKTANFSPAPGTIPATVNPPRDPSASAAASTASSEPVVDATRPSSALLATAAPNAASDNIFSNLARKIGFGSSDTTASAKPVAPAKPKAAAAQHTAPHRTAAAKPAAPKKNDKTNDKARDRTAEPKHIATAHPPLKPAAATDTPTPPASVPGTAPVVSSNSFNSRFSAFR